MLERRGRATHGNTLSHLSFALVHSFFGSLPLTILGSSGHIKHPARQHPTNHLSISTLRDLKPSHQTEQMAAGDGPLHPLEPHRPATTTTTIAPAVSGTASGTTTRRRAKSFLRNYYGIQQADAALQEGTREKSGSHAGGATLTKADPYDLGKKKKKKGIYHPALLH